MTDLLIRLLALLGIFASIFLLSQVVLGAAWRGRARYAAVNQRLRMIREGANRQDIALRLRKNIPQNFDGYPLPVARVLHAFQLTLFASAAPFSLEQVLLGMAVLFGVTLFILIMVTAVTGFALGVGIFVMLATVAAAVGIGLPVMMLNWRAQRRRKKVEEQFPVALDVFVRALRSGHPVASAIELLTEEMADPIGSEFGLVSDEVAYGADLTDAVEAMADRWDLEDIRMFVVSLAVQTETGGNLAEILDNLAEVIRARASLYRKVRSLSSEGRMTGWMLTVLPVLTFIGMFLVNPGFYLDASHDIIFVIGFPGLILLYLLGVLWIRHLVNIKV